MLVVDRRLPAFAVKVAGGALRPVLYGDEQPRVDWSDVSSWVVLAATADGAIAVWPSSFGDGRYPGPPQGKSAETLLGADIETEPSS